MGQVIAVCGMPASGKGEFAKIVAEKGIPVRSMGDMVRLEVKQRDLPETPNVFGEIAADLRAKYGDDILASRLAVEVDGLLENNDIVFIDGLRGIAEKKFFRKHWGSKFSTVAIETTKEIRFKRVLSRNRSEDGDRAAFEIRDKREKGWGLELLIAESDIIFTNNGEFSEFIQKVRDWLETL